MTVSDPYITQLKNEVIQLQKRLEQLQCRYDKVMEVLEAMPVSLRDLISDWGDCDKENENDKN